MVKSAIGLRPLVPPMATSEPFRLPQQRPGGAGEPHMGEEFQRIAFLPVGVGEFEKIAALGGAGIVDQNVEAAEIACRRIRSAPPRAIGSRRSTISQCGAAAMPRGSPRRPRRAPRRRARSASGRSPRSASANAMPRPMPRLDPVTSATFPLSPKSMCVMPSRTSTEPIGLWRRRETNRRSGYCWTLPMRCGARM